MGDLGVVSGAGFSMTFRGYRYIYIDIRNVH